MVNLHNVRKVVKDFPGSVVLEQEAKGHCALGNAVPSPCTLRYLRDYFQGGGVFQNLGQSVARITMCLMDRVSDRGNHFQLACLARDVEV